MGLIALAVMTRSVLGQEAKPPADTMRAVPIEQTEADAVFTDYTFRDGEKLSQLRIHYVTLGHKHLNVRGEIDNAILLLHWTNASSQALVTPEALSSDTFVGYETAARQRLRGRDKEDWPILAAAISLACGIWTEDTDFFGAGVALWTTDRVELFLSANAETPITEDE